MAGWIHSVLKDNSSLTSVRPVYEVGHKPFGFLFPRNTWNKIKFAKWKYKKNPGEINVIFKLLRGYHK